MVTYADAVVYSQALFSPLRLPQCSVPKGGGRRVWALGVQPLLLPGVGQIWTERSERNGLTSLAAARGFAECERRRLGRWPAEVSEGYVRTSRAIVEKIQTQISEAVREKFDEEDIVDDEEVLRKVEGHMVKDQIRRLRYFSEGPAGRIETLEGWIGVSSPESSSEDTKEVEAPLEAGEYFITLTHKARVRRLHRAGGCGNDQRKVYDWIGMGKELPSPATYDFTCKLCCPKKQAGAEDGADEEASSSTSSEFE